MIDSPFTAEAAILQIIEHLDRCGGNYRDWYASMAAHPDHVLFTYHLVDQREGQYMYCRIRTYIEARNVLDQLRSVYGIRIGPVVGGADALYVYLFKMMNWTRE